MLTDLSGLHQNKLPYFCCIYHTTLMYSDSEGGKDVVLDENDLFWSRIRTWHISKVMEFVTNEFEKFKSENKAAQWEMQGTSASASASSSGGGAGATTNIEVLKDVMSSFGDYAVTKEALGRHQNLCLGVSKIYESRALEGVVEIEQDLITTCPHSDSSAFAKICKRVEGVLGDERVEYLDKIRLLFLLVVVKEGISDSERERYVSLFRVGNEEMQALVNLNLLDVKLSPSLDKRRASEIRVFFLLSFNLLL